MKHKIAHVDFETRAARDLKKTGVEKYVRCPHFASACIAWGFDGLPVEGAHLFGAPCPEPLAEHVAAGGLVGVHNRSFELNVWAEERRRNPAGWPELRAEQIVDTMALARALSLPGALGELAKALRLSVEKDEDGRKLMLKLCKPRKPRKSEPDGIYWQGTPEEFERQLAYCKRDVETERAVFDVLPPLNPREQKLFLLDYEINSRGIYVDLPAVSDLLEVAEIEKDRLNDELRELTSGAVKTATSTAALLKWLHQFDEVRALENLRKDTVEEQLERPAGELRPEVKRALEIRAECNKASTAKLAAMIHGAGEDGRLRGLLEYHGASTGRWAGRRVQPQNMIRPPKEWEDHEVEFAEETIFAATAGAEVATAYLNARFENALTATAASLRSLLIAAPGFRLISADYANIEGRVLAWLAGEDWKVQAFKDYDTFVVGEDGKSERKGHDLYKLAFAAAFGVDPGDVTKPQRQIGKVQELALGYQGAHGAFLSMGKNYRVNLDEIAVAVQESVPPAVWDDALWRYWQGSEHAVEDYLADFRAMLANAENNGESLDGFVEPDDAVRDMIRGELMKAKRFGLCEKRWAAIRIIVDGWRNAHPNIVRFWYDLNDAAIRAVQNPGEVTRVGRIRYRLCTLHGRRFLLCELPSGRWLGYPNARIEWETRTFRDGTGYVETRRSPKLVFEGVSSKTRRWQTQRAYGGLLAENVTQAVARDVLADALLRLEPAGYRTVLHVHDEIVAEMPNGSGTFEEFCDLMGQLEPWAAGLPVAVDGWEGKRYRK